MKSSPKSFGRKKKKKKRKKAKAKKHSYFFTISVIMKRGPCTCSRKEESCADAIFLSFSKSLLFLWVRH